MLLRIVAYLGLGVNVVRHRDFVLAAFCFVTPFIGPYGMITAVLAGAGFAIFGRSSKVRLLLALWF